jgi:hypothetical protein
MDSDARAATQRDVRSASLFVALLMLIMAGMTILAVVNFLPLFEAVPVSPTEGSEQQ